MTETGWTLPGVETTRMTSEGGAAFEVHVARPRSPAPPDGYPVLVLLDAGAYFGTLIEMIRLRRNRPAMTGIEATLLVGVSHPDVRPYDRGRRAREYAAPPEGTAHEMLSFLVDTVKPAVASRHAVDPSRWNVFGHSLAGAFVLYAFAARSEAFAGYHAASPSIWTLRDELDRRLAALADRADPPPSPRTVIVHVGEYDQAIAPWQRSAPDQEAFRARRAQRAMVDEARRVSGIIERLGGDWSSTHFEVLEGEDHASIVPVAMSRGLRRLVGIRSRARDGFQGGSI